jgi:WD40 repeat protein
MFNGHTAEIQSCDFSPDGREVVTVGCDEKGLVFALSGELLGSMEGHNGIVFGCAWGRGPAAQLILTVSQDNSTKVWQRQFIQKPEVSTVVAPARVLRLLLEKDASALHVLDYGMQYLRYASPFTEPLVPEYKGQAKGIQDCTMADLDKGRENWVVTSYESIVRLFKTDGTALSQLKSNGGALIFCSWDPNGKPRIALCGHGGGLELRSPKRRPVKTSHDGSMGL